MDESMSPEHTSQYELVKALRDLGASQCRVGDVEARFDLVAVPLVDPDGERNAREMRLKIAQLEKELGL